uniref:SAWADEE domain-containing protein n=1 Tax=Oryza punctata TaxID=4537 RepID=A0A0E0L208_ORYPU
MPSARKKRKAPAAPAAPPPRRPPSRLEFRSPADGAWFRAPSTPLDDARCRDLRPGDPLCVACALAGGVELKYYDAVLESVSPAAHETVDGEERCACRFSVRWADGPLAGLMAEVGVEQVCCVRSTPVRDPVLAEFLDGVASKSPGDGEGNATAASRSSGAVAP